jgi:uncharacterized repeat protein (TIGR03803 family)
VKPHSVFAKVSRSMMASTLCVLMWVAVPGISFAQSFTSLYSFCSQANCPDGNVPNGWLVQGSDGNFYGTASAGGADGFGTVFKITPAGHLTTLHSFNSTDGSEPSALIRASDGNFYGTTASGGGTNCSRGSNACGTVFKITPAGALTTLYAFCARANCTDGFNPAAALVEGSDGDLYGTTADGGAAGQCETLGCGTVFKITLAGALTTLYTFCPGGHCTNAADGANPNAALVRGSDGSFYGTTENGGGATKCLFGCGTVFKVSATGTFVSLHAFNGTDGINPGQLIQALDGNFYGTTPGNIFKMTASGSLTPLHTFRITDGYIPVGLIQGTDGNLYGVTQQGGNNQDCIFGCGTVFKATTSDSFTTLHNFTGSDGSAAIGGLVQGTDGALYGTTSKGGSSTHCQGGCGTVFKLGVGLTPFVEAQPLAGDIGAPVTILGSNLSGATRVAFNGLAASFNIVSSSEITTTVPAGATTGKIQVTASGDTLTSYNDFQILTALQFVPVAPCRLLDTRTTHTPVQGGTSQSFILSELGGCNIPASAAAYALNVTAAPHGSLGYLTVWPDGEVQPAASTMNSPDGRIKANAAIVPSGNNAISVFASDTTDLLLDINGYFISSGSSTLQFYPLPPCRIADTRNPNGPLGGPYLLAGQERDFPVLDSSCRLPSGASAYSLNFTVIPRGGGYLGYLTVWPQGQTQPRVSTLNDPTGTLVANAALVPAGTSGGVATFPSNDTDLVIDVDGYFAAPGPNGLSLYAANPCRVLDTRLNNGAPFTGEKTVDVIGSPCAPPASAKAFLFNATVVPPGPMPYLKLWAHGENQPDASTLNAYDGAVTSNMAIVPTNDGSIDAYAAGLTHLLVDIFGYFAP